MEVIRFQVKGTVHESWLVGRTPTLDLGVLVPGRQFAFQTYSPEIETPSRWKSLLYEMFFESRDGKAWDDQGNEFNSYENIVGLIRRTAGLPRIGELPGFETRVVEGFDMLKDGRYAR